MINPRHIAINDYAYILPEERIAAYPLAKRDASELLVYRDNEIVTDTYKNISHHIPENSLLIFNNTKVVEARLLFQKPTGGVIEIFCLAPHEQYADITTAMLQQKKVVWQCLVGGASKWKTGQLLELKITQDKKDILLHARFIEKRSDSFIIELFWTPEHFSFAEILHIAGALPLPPYIKRPAEESDAERYQTVYAEMDGSVAAPTAGLHFTVHILESLLEKKISLDFLTLHVGAGTFKPVKSTLMQDHEMHAEWIDVKHTTIEKLLDNLSNAVVAVGTTSLRTLESLYWLGVKHAKEEYKEPANLLQWDAYTLEKKQITVEEALQALLNWMKKNNTKRYITKTQILIAPGYSFKLVNGLVTNFHQPQSTLLLLVAALIGEDWRKVYDYALENNFRFLSYGDGSLLWRK